MDYVTDFCHYYDTKGDFRNKYILCENQEEATLIQKKLQENNIAKWGHQHKVFTILEQPDCTFPQFIQTSLPDNRRDVVTMLWCGIWSGNNNRYTSNTMSVKDALSLIRKIKLERLKEFTIK